MRRLESLLFLLAGSFDLLAALAVAVLVGLAVLLLLLLPLIMRAGTRRGARFWFNGGLARFAGTVRFAYWETQLRQAGLQLSPADVAAVALGLALGGAVGVSLAFGYFLIAGVVGLALGALPFLWVRRRVSRREREFVREVQGWCNLLAGLAEVGFSGLNLLEFATQAPAPLGAYFQEVVQAIRSGQDSLRALDDLAARPHPPVLDDLITAFRLHLDTAGEIGGLLKRAAANIGRAVEVKDDMRLRLQALMTRYWLVCSISVVLLLVIRVELPQAADALLGSTLGQLAYLSLWAPVLLVSFFVRRLSRLPGLERTR